MPVHDSNPNERCANRGEAAIAAGDAGWGTHDLETSAREAIGNVCHALVRMGLEPMPTLRAGHSSFRLDLSLRDGAGGAPVAIESERWSHLPATMASSAESLRLRVEEAKVVSRDDRTLRLGADARGPSLILGTIQDDNVLVLDVYGGYGAPFTRVRLSMGESSLLRALLVAAEVELANDDNS